LPKELASAEALRQRVSEGLGRVEQEEGPNYENLTDKDAGLLSTLNGELERRCDPTHQIICDKALRA